MIPFIAQIDKDIIIYIKDHFVTDYLNVILIIFSILGNYGIIWLILSGSISYKKKNIKIFISTVIALTLTVLIVDLLLKGMVGRERPPLELYGLRMAISIPSSTSFPSGHTASSFAAAYILSKYVNKAAIHLYTLAATISISRVYLFLHYPSDVFVGMLIGLLCGMLAWSYQNRIKH